MNSTIGDVTSLASLQGPKYTHVQSIDDIHCIAADAGADSTNATSAVVVAQDGALVEVWLAESARPFELTADYIRVA